MFAWHLLLFLYSVGPLASTASAGAGEIPTLQVIWKGNSATKLLHDWSPGDLKKFKQFVQREKDPLTGKFVRWRGVRLRNLVEQALEELTLEQRAEVDLVVLQNGKRRADVPRSMTIKYPLLLALSRQDQPLGERGPFLSIVPWTSASKLQDEVLPLGTYFVEGIRKIILTNYRYQYPVKLFVTDRKDPLVLRGEKRFVQLCLGCHATQKISFKGRDMYEMAVSSELFSQTHRDVEGMPMLRKLDIMGLTSYFREARTETQTLALTQ